MRLRKTAKIPNRVIDGGALAPTGKVLLTAMIFMARKDGSLRASIDELASVSHLSSNTIRKRIDELVSLGYINKNTNYRYSEHLKLFVYTKNTYTLTLPQEGGYTLLPRAVLDLDITPSTFAVMLYLYRCAGREGRSYPSIRHIAGIRKEGSNIPGCGISKASVCRALAVLEKLLIVIKMACKNTWNELQHYCNSYLITNMVKKGGITESSQVVAGEPERPKAAPLVEGGLKNDKYPWVNKITGVLLAQSKKTKDLLNMYLRCTTVWLAAKCPPLKDYMRRHTDAAPISPVRPPPMNGDLPHAIGICVYQKKTKKLSQAWQGEIAGARDPPAPGRGAQPLQNPGRGCP